MKKFISILLTLIISIVACFSLVACSNSNEKANIDIPTINSSNSINYISLYSSPATYSDNYVVKTITATVYPDDAVDKSVDWNVLWITNNEGEEVDVEDYVTVEPTSDGALTAEVRCYKAFENSVIGVKVTTRVGSCSAMCNVTYVGEPSSLQIEQKGGTSVYDSSIRKEIFHFDVGNKENSLEIKLDNIFNNVTENYIGNFNVFIHCEGCYEVTHSDYYGNTTHFDTALSWKSHSETSGSVGVYFDNGHGLNFFTYNLTSRSLNINMTNSFSSFAFSNGYDHYSTVDNYYDIPYCVLTVQDPFLGLSSSIYLRLVSSITDVSLDGDIVF